jgi:hypothetical protein
MGILDNGRPKSLRSGQREVELPRPDNTLIDLLTPEEQAELKAEARKQVEADRKKAAREKYLAHAVQEARAEFEPDQEMISIQIDLAGHSKSIVLDAGTRNGGVYHHGYTYLVTRSVYTTLQEIMARGWAHEEETGIPNHKIYRRPNFIGMNYNDPGQRITPIAPTIGNRNADVPAEVIVHNR